MDRAMDAAYADSRWSNGHLYPEGWADFEDGLKLAAPVIAEAAYRAGRQAERETVESLISACIADDPMAERVESRNKTLFDLRDALAALTDTEGQHE